MKKDMTLITETREPRTNITQDNDIIWHALTAHFNVRARLDAEILRAVEHRLPGDDVDTMYLGMLHEVADRIRVEGPYIPFNPNQSEPKY